MPTFHATATDTLGGTDSVDQVVASGGTVTRTVRRSLMENRVNWGSVVDANDLAAQGPHLSTEGSAGSDYVQAPDGPVTLGHLVQMQRDCDLVGVRIYKVPDLAGDIGIGIWLSDGTELDTFTVTWIADEGGWREIEFPTPIPVTNALSYVIGYHVPGNDYAYQPWVWNGQDYVSYPFAVKTFTEFSGVRSQGSVSLAGASLAFPSAHHAADYYIDPIAEWEETTPGYAGGLEYFAQFEVAGSRFDFPIAVFFADPENLQGYADLGVNTLIAGDAKQEYIDAVLAADMDWYPALHGNDMRPIVAVAEDPALAQQVRGYMLTDEPDLISPYNPPATVRSWHTAARYRDSTRPIYLNLSYLPVKTQGFQGNPVGASMQVKNAAWREYAAMPDILSCDFYSLAGSDSFGPSNGELNGESFGRYGIWAYPPQVRRMRDLSDDKVPIWGVVETTSQVPDRPDPDQVVKAIWSLLIAGARGIVIFDHRFASLVVTQDFATILNNEEMGDAIAALANQLQSLSGPLMAPEVEGVVESVIWSNTTEGPIGGTYGVPVHHTVREDAGTTYLFAQAIRPGATDATFEIPGDPDTELTVLGESRTVTTDADGFFDDSFAADYDYHLYSWTSAGTALINSSSLIDSDTVFNEGGIG